MDHRITCCQSNVEPIWDASVGALNYVDDDLSQMAEREAVIIMKLILEMIPLTAMDIIVAASFSLQWSTFRASQKRVGVIYLYFFEITQLVSDMKSRRSWNNNSLLKSFTRYTNDDSFRAIEKWKL